MKILISLLVIFSGTLAWGTNYTVKAGGGGSFTTMGACATQMSSNGTGVSDTCTVFAGTYNENVSVPAGSAGNYKIFNVNGTDVVMVQSFTLGSHTKVIGFNIQNPSSPASTYCVSLSASATDVFIQNNTITQCGAMSNPPAAVNIPTSASFVYFQGNTMSYTCTTPTLVASCAANHGSGPDTNCTCNGVADWGSHTLIENNDFSHYTLGTSIQGTFHITRNNTFHDQFEVEARSNQHTDAIYSEPNISTGSIVMEGNFERNAVGSNAKGYLTQNDNCSPGPCTWTNVIERFNVFSRLGSAVIANDKSWPNVKVYNTTFVDEGMEATLTFGGDDMLSTGGGMAVLNSIWYESASVAGSASCTPSGSLCNWNPYACTGCANYGHNLYWCTGTCTSVFGHTYGGAPFLSDPGNLNNDPLFVSYVSAGSVSNDYRLQSGSPARNAGTSLTTVNGTIVSSTSLVVADATYFQDGFSLSNSFSTVQGDCISVTTVGNHVCISSINYSTNTLTLASPISATNGDPVWLYSKSDGVRVLFGSAPDMGAFPANPSATSTPSFLLRAGDQGARIEETVLR